MTWKIGKSKVDITPEHKGVVMLGYSYLKNVVKGVETPINARAIIFENSHAEYFIYLNYELCFITQSLRHGIIKGIKKTSTLPSIPDSHIMITAQHTHSAPSGYSHYPLYNIPTGGYIPSLCELLVQKGIEACQVAFKQRSPANLSFSKGRYDETIEVAFNRSIKAYKNNPECQDKNIRPGQAVNRECYQLNIEQNKKNTAIINWFGVHATSISNKNTLISPDHKGYASIYFEDYLQESEDITKPVAIFAQECCGDISPNFAIKEDNPREWRGRYQDQFESARYNAGLQFVKAKELVHQKTKKQITQDIIDSEIVFVDMSKQKIKPEYLPKDSKSPYTAPANFGTSFITGTVDGRGVSDFLHSFVYFFSSLIYSIKGLLLRYKKAPEAQELHNDLNGHYPKKLFVEAGRKKVLGFQNLNLLPIPSLIDPILKRMKASYRKRALDEHSWVQQILPFQITCLGQLAIIALPNEPSTIAGVRIRNALAPILQKRGIEDIVLSPYANAYSGYMITPEEYDEQLYEAGHTLFGRNTLPAGISVLTTMAQEMLKDKKKRQLDTSVHPPHFTQQELLKRTVHFNSSLS